EPDRIVIRLANNLLFNSASADVRPEATRLLDVAAAALAQVPNEVSIEGHTDNIPVGTDRYPTNWELSSARATAVLRYLVEHGGLLLRARRLGRRAGGRRGREPDPRPRRGPARAPHRAEGPRLQPDHQRRRTALSQTQRRDRVRDHGPGLVQARRSRPRREVG